MDASFLYMETPDMHMHVVGTILLDPSTIPGGGDFLSRLKGVLAERIHLLAPFRQRLVQVPFRMDHPVWVEDPNFDLDSHVHHIGAPSPGTRRELEEVIGDIASYPLDRSRPLWEMWFIDGLDDGLVAIVSKMHHAVIDGVTGADLMVNLFDLTPDPPPVTVPEDWRPERTPSDVELVGAALVRMATRPLRLGRFGVRAARGVTNLIRNRLGADASPAAAPFTAPRVPWNTAITPHRSVTFGRADLEDMKTIKRAFGTTVNDVVLAACTQSLRQWLIAHDALPSKPLIASVPVSVHTEQQDAPGTNKVSSMFVALPVQVDDPVEQLLAIKENTKGAKEVHKALGADMIIGMAEFAPPMLLNQASRLYSRLDLAQRHRPIHNLVVSNVPGPPVPLYCAGSRVVATYPMGPVLEGAGLNITVLSNMGNVDFGAIACRELVPDLDDLATGFADAVDALKVAAEKVGSSPPAE
jgi:diacylglycerol O-acyltransferase / wax synthase